MQLRVNGVVHDFISLKEFRETYDLPDSFQVSLFEPKDYTGLGRIDQAGGALNQVKAEVLNAIPQTISPQGWMDGVPRLAEVFRSMLNAINHEVGLRDPEIDFAVNGFSDVCSQLAYALIRHQYAGEPIPLYKELYSTWLYDTVQVGGSAYTYEHNGQTWTIYAIIHAYGRVGLKIDMGEQTYYVADKRLACPAEGYMETLLDEVYRIVLDRLSLNP